METPGPGFHCLTHPRPHTGLWKSLLNRSSRETPTRAQGLGGLMGRPAWSLEAPRERERERGRERVHAAGEPWASCLFQELVLLCGDPHCLVPRAEWHLPAEGAAELPLADELPWEQVSETVWSRSCWRSCCGRRAGAEGKPGTPRVGGQRAHCPFPGTPLWLLGHPGELPGGGFPHSPAHLHSVSVHSWRTGQPSSQGLPVQLFS